MLKFKILFILTLFTLFIDAQDLYKSYYNAFSKKYFNTYIAHNDINEYVLFIDLLSTDSNRKYGGIMVSTVEHENFLQILDSAKQKYVEWIDIAKKNNIHSFNKKMKYKSIVGGGYFEHKKDLNIEYLIYLSFNFKIDEDKYYLSFKTGELASTIDNSIKHEGFVLIFSSVEEIEYFIELLSKDNVNVFLKNNNNFDLFKD
jgi:hypothetical protein